MASALDRVNLKSDADVENGSQGTLDNAKVTVMDHGYAQELKRQLTLLDIISFMYNEAGATTYTDMTDQRAWIAALNSLTIPFYNGGQGKTTLDWPEPY
ncbi:uncharacterized protein N7473_001810 [Penicillium subrubescens]|uniref:uncharacterized protein n=1 Tax=Penicillium subrubescens TaxID=1316194 RepID=UPI0025459EF2|nr:uncharacterized protein N7473_001810 [Penicillium subrubescens]KAJ5904894.1 hypothetical protein N7473_001810 [Penicillium subrubescens]